MRTVIRPIILSIACLAVTLLHSHRAGASDWPEFRGPKRDGISGETGLLKTWPEGGPKLAWQVKGLGEGYSGVAVVGNTIYTAGDKGDASHAIALNRENGAPLWSTKLGKPGAVGSPKFDGPRGTPTLDGNLVFVLDQWGELVCFEAAGGKEVWRKDLVDDLGGTLPTWGYAESPLVDGDNVIVTPGGEKGAVAALNKKTGAVVWRSTEFTDAAH